MYADTVGANKGRGKRHTICFIGLGVLPSFYRDCVGSKEKIYMEGGQTLM